MVFGEGAGVKPMEQMMPFGHQHGSNEKNSGTYQQDGVKDSVDKKKELKNMKY